MTNDFSSQPPESANAPAKQEPPPAPPTPSPTPQRFAAATQLFQRHLLPFLLPPLLLLVITAMVVVAFGIRSGAACTSGLQVGPLVVTKAVVAAGLGVLVSGSGALRLARGAWSQCAI